MAASNPPRLRFECPTCHARMEAQAALAGAKRTCPKCGGPIVLPSVSPETAVAATAAADEGYEMWETVDQPPPDSRIAHGPYIPVVCKLCQTRMHATPDAVGRTIECPDCGRKAVVPPMPAALPKKKPPLLDDDEEGYELMDEAELRRPDVVPTYIAVVCRNCKTRMYGTEDQVGQEIICPDCGRPEVVPPPPGKRKPKRPELAGESYELDESRAPPERRERVESGMDREDLQSYVRTRPELPRRPLLTGVFAFPFYSSVWPRWSALTAIAVVLCVAWIRIIEVLTYLSFESILGVFALGVLSFVTLIWAIFASAHCLAILVDTSCGNDQVENWPTGFFVEQIPQLFYVASAFSISGLPAWLAVMVGISGLAKVVAIATSVLILFPLVLLSMLEAGSPLTPWSPIIWQSTKAARSTWVAFYAETFLLAAGTGVLVVLAGSLVLLSVPLAIAALIIYFRLLGRLAWVAAEAVDEETEELDESEESDEESADE